MAIIRLLAVGMAFHAKDMSRSVFLWLASVFMPIIYGATASFMFDAGTSNESLLPVALGSAMIGAWMTTLYGAGLAIENQRWRGTLELLFAAPTPFLLTLAPLTIVTAGLGLYSVAATLLSGWALFGMPLDVADPLLLVVALLATLLGMGFLGIVFASSFVLYRHAQSFSQLLDQPLWLASGLLVPLSLLPGWVEPFSWVLAPKWGMDAMRNAASGAGVAAPLAACVALGIAYLALGALLVRNLERLARSRATLSLT